MKKFPSPRKAGRGCPQGGRGALDSKEITINTPDKNYAATHVF